MKLLKNKVALITGSAKGLGREIALCLAQNGADIVIHYNKSRAEADKVTKIIKDLGRDAIQLKAELINITEIEDMLTQAYNKFGKIDILINNVGNFIMKDIKDIEFNEWKDIIDTTLNSTYFCCRACLPYMRKNNYGRIINIGDSEADKLSASLKMTPYKIGKVGITILTKSLALSEAGNNITVNQVSPGIMLNSKFKPDLSEMPKKRYARYEDVINAIIFLLSPKSEYITGANIVIAGAWNL